MVAPPLLLGVWAHCAVAYKVGWEADGEVVGMCVCK